MYSQSTTATRGADDVTVYTAFTPASTAVFGAIPRPAITTAIASALAIPGRQLFLYGRSGNGKSTALFAELSRPDAGPHVVVRCTAESTVDSLLRTGLREYGLPAQEDHAVAVGQLADVLGANGTTVVIEDAHHLAEPERRKLLTTMKVASDLGRLYPALTVVVVAAVEWPGDFGAFELEHSIRISQVRVPSMTPSELEMIVRRGGTLLDADTSQIAALIAACSGGSAAITHQLALSSFLAAGVLVSGERRVVPVSAFRDAATNLLGTVPRESQSRIETALSSTRHRREVESILTALSDSDPEGASIDEVARVASFEGSDYIPDVIARLTEPSHGQLLEQAGSPDRVRFSYPGMNSYWALLSRSSGTVGSGQSSR